MGILERLLWFTLLTHPLMTPMGAGVIGKETLDACIGAPDLWCSICQDSCDDKDHHSEGILQKFAESGMILVDKGLVVIKNFLIYNTPENPSVLAGWVSTCEDLPRSKIFRHLLGHLSEEMGRKPEWLFEGLLNPLAEQRPRGLKNWYWERIKDYAEKPKGKRKRKKKQQGQTPPKTPALTAAPTPVRHHPRQQEQEQDSFKDLKDLKEKSERLQKPNFTPKEIQTQIGISLKRYSSEQYKYLRSAMEVIKTLYRENEYTAKLKLGILRELEKYPADIVAESCWAYVEKKDRKPSMREDYLISIVKNKSKNREAQQAEQARKNSVDPESQWMDPEGERVWPRSEIEIQLDKIRQQLEDGIKPDEDMLDTLRRCGKERPEWGVEVPV